MCVCSLIGQRFRPAPSDGNDEVFLYTSEELQSVRVEDGGVELTEQPRRSVREILPCSPDVRFLETLAVPIEQVLYRITKWMLARVIAIGSKIIS